MMGSFLFLIMLCLGFWFMLQRVQRRPGEA
jgi:preprotein translocase subunit YajC